MDPCVAVIGTIFIDCKGFARDRYNPLGRNLGSIKFVHGGVGRNVAENLANLNLPVVFVSTVDRSALGREVVSRIGKSGINLDFLAYADQGGMGMWMAVLDRKGDLMGSISQMPDLGLLEGLLEKMGRQIVEKASHIVLELDLNERISRSVTGMAIKYNRPIFGIPGNLEVILGNRDLLGCLDCFICNDIEAGRLLGRDLDGMETGGLQEILAGFVAENGMRSAVFTLGARGAVYYDAGTGEGGWQPAVETGVRDSSGAGDAFFSGTVMGLARSRPLREAVVYGTKVASLTIQVEENTCPDLRDRLQREGLPAEVLPSQGRACNMATG